MRNFNLLYDFKHYLSEKVKLGYGLQATYYDFNPGELTPIGDATIRHKVLPHKYALETGFYGDIEHKISEHLTFSYGLRWSSFFHLGKRTMNKYLNDEAVVSILLSASMSVRPL